MPSVNGRPRIVEVLLKRNDWNVAAMFGVGIFKRSVRYDQRFGRYLNAGETHAVHSARWLIGIERLGLTVYRRGCDAIAAQGGQVMGHRGKRLPTPATPDLANHATSVSRKNVVRVLLAGLSFMRCRPPGLSAMNLLFLNVIAANTSAPSEGSGSRGI